MKILPLEEAPYVAPIISNWIKNEWGNLDIIDHYKTIHLDQCKNRKSLLPKTLVMLSDGNEAMGSISILFNDMETKPHLNPWLGCLYVDKKHRGKSVARALVASCEVMAYELGIKKLYLFTSKIEKLARSSGWKPLERTFFEGETVVIMSKTF